MIQVPEHLRIKRRFHITHELSRPGIGSFTGERFASFTVMRSYAEAGFFRSGFNHAVVSSEGTMKLMSQPAAQKRVALLKEAGWKDSRDPGYDGEDAQDRARSGK